MYLTCLGFRVDRSAGGDQRGMGKKELYLSAIDPLVTSSPRAHVRVRGCVDTSFCCLSSALDYFNGTPYSSGAAKLAYALTFEVRDSRSLIQDGDLSCWCSLQYTFDCMHGQWLSYHSLVGAPKHPTFDDRCPVVAYWDHDGYCDYGLCVFTRFSCHPDLSVFQEAARDELDLFTHGFGLGETHWGALARGRVWAHESYPVAALRKMLTVLDMTPDPPGPAWRRPYGEEETVATTDSVTDSGSGSGTDTEEWSS